MTISTGYPLTIPTIARPMPVLPDVGSMMVLPGVSLPSRSASSIILTAMRSLMLPVGLKPSSLAKILTCRLGEKWFRRTIGVEPIVPRILS